MVMEAQVTTRDLWKIREWQNMIEVCSILDEATNTMMTQMTP